MSHQGFAKSAPRTAPTAEDLRELSVYAGDPSCGGAAEAALEGSRGWGSLLQVRLDDRPGPAAAATAAVHGHAEQPRRLPDVAATEVGKRDAEQQDLRRAEGAEPAGRSD